MTTAVVLQEAGYPVRLLARDFSPNTTSNLAGAIWYPSHAWPLEKTRAWGLETLNELLRLEKEEGSEQTGIRLVKGVRHFYRQMGFPWWRNHVPHFRILSESERPERVRTSYEYTVPIVSMDHYLGTYLLGRFQRAGGEMVEKEFNSKQEMLSASESILVNCTGLGSYSLLNDRDLYPVRGQILESSNERLKDFVLSADHPDGSIYVIPRANGVVVGGGSRSGVWSTETDEKQAADTLALATRLNPTLHPADSNDWSIRVGLRPGRKTVRCEIEGSTDGKKVVHNYGHTGAGVTLSWGCAREVLSLVRRVD